MTGEYYRGGNTLGGLIVASNWLSFWGVGYMNATRTGPLPPAILERQDLQRALAEHDFGSAFALVKKYGGISQNRIAVACQLTPGKVSNIIGGRHQITSYEVIARISDGLRIPGEMLGLARRSWEEGSGKDDRPDESKSFGPPGAGGGPWCRADAAAMAARVTRSDLVMDRRAVSRAIAASVTTGVGLLSPLDGWLEPAAADGHRAGRGRLGQEDVLELESAARAFRMWDHQFGGGLRRRAVVGQLSEVSVALEERQTPEIEERLYRVMAQLAGTAATMAWDSGMQQKAQEYYRVALRAAHAGSDRAFGVNVLAGMARQMLYAERAQDALELVRLAQQGGSEADPRLRAMVHTREAWALSVMGRMSGFRRATEQARELLAAATSSPQGPYWIAYFDEAEISGVTGGRLLDLARNDPRTYAEEAAEHIRSALSRRGSEARRSHALDRLGLAECAYLMGDTRVAVAETHHAVEAAKVTKSSRVHAQLRELYPYTVGHAASRGVKDARDSIRELLAG